MSTTPQTRPSARAISSGLRIVLGDRLSGSSDDSQRPDVLSFFQRLVPQARFMAIKVPLRDRRARPDVQCLHSVSLGAIPNRTPSPDQAQSVQGQNGRLCRGGTMSHPTRRFFIIVALIGISITCLHSRGIAQDKGAAATTDQSAQYPDARPITDKDIQMLRQDIRSQRKQLIAANMKLTDVQAEKFWPIYDQYINELVANNSKKYALIKQFVQTGGILTDAEAEDSVKEWVSIDESVAALRQKYIPLFGKVLSPKDKALFYQLDRRVQLMIDLQLIALIPMVEPQ